LGSTKRALCEGCIAFAGWHVSMFNIGNDVVKRVTEQTDDGVELVIAYCHLGGKIAFHDRRRPLAARLHPTRECSVSPRWLRRPRL
jgi:hypothetical protein